MPIDVNARLVRRNGADFILVDDSDLGGGYRVVADVTARDAIPASMLKLEMRVVLQDTGKIYRLTAISPLTWVEDLAGSEVQTVTDDGADHLTTVDNTDPANPIIDSPAPGSDGAGVISRNGAWVVGRFTYDDIDAAFTIAVSGEPGTQEIGATTAAPTITATMSRSYIGAVTVDDGSGAVSMTDSGDHIHYTHTYGAGYLKTGNADSVTFTVSANGKTAAASTVWYARVKYGYGIEAPGSQANYDLLQFSALGSVAFSDVVVGGVDVIAFAFIPASLGGSAAIVTSTVSGFGAPHSLIGPPGQTITNAESLAVVGDFVRVDAGFGADATWKVNTP
jgi:hypothetical protein